MQLSHEKLDVYQKATEFLALSAQLLDAMPKGHKTLVDQLRRSALSVVLNIAEAAGKPSRAEGRHHFAIARGSALECGAALDAVRLLSLGDKATVERGKSILVSVVSMLSKLCRSQGSSPAAYDEHAEVQKS
jgi:four helix bundle protein